MIIKKILYKKKSIIKKMPYKKKFYKKKSYKKKYYKKQCYKKNYWSKISPLVFIYAKYAPFITKGEIAPP